MSQVQIPSRFRVRGCRAWQDALWSLTCCRDSVEKRGYALEIPGPEVDIPQVGFRRVSGHGFGRRAEQNNPHKEVVEAQGGHDVSAGGEGGLIGVGGRRLLFLYSFLQAALLPVHTS